MQSYHGRWFREQARLPCSPAASLRYNQYPVDHFPHAQPRAESAPEPPVPGSAEPLTVGVFDSGIGGLTVARAILSRRPDLNLVYFGDSMNLPYGGRMPEQLRSFGYNNIEFLLSHDISILAVGCNSINCVVGQSQLNAHCVVTGMTRLKHGIPMYDLVSSTVDWLRVQHGRPSKLGLMGTVATVQSCYWERKLSNSFPDMHVITEACPEFVPLIEAGDTPVAVLRQVVRERLQPFLEAGIRTVLHACTHYPWLDEYMREVDPDLSFIDPAECLAERLCASLPPAAGNGKPGKRQLFNSRPSEVFYRMATKALGVHAREATRMYIVNPYED
jgi:glutamate racemase